MLVVLANFADSPQPFSLRSLRAEGLAHFFKDRLSGREVSTRKEIILEPYELLWLEED
jgi:hypothetical protein